MVAGIASLPFYWLAFRMLASNYKSQTFRSGDVDISFRLFGRPGQTPVIIVHGLSFFSYDWIEAAEGLSANRQVAAMDMRGFGDSDWSKDYSISAFSSDIIGLMDHLGWQQAVLIGHSMGGRNVAFCAAKNPGRVAALILVDWSPDIAPAGGKRVTELVANTPDVFATIDDAMRFFKIDPQSPQGGRKRARFEAYLKPAPGGLTIKRDPHFREEFRQRLRGGPPPKHGVDLWATLSAIKCPLLVIRGSRSDLFAAETVGKIKAANPEAKVVEVNSGHNIAGENLQEFLNEAKAFLGALGGTQ